MDNNIPENVRERIKQLIDECSENLPISDQLKHMLVQICYKMYKAGYKDSFRIIEASIKLQKDLFNGKQTET